MANLRKANISETSAGLVCTKCAYAPGSLPRGRNWKKDFEGIDPIYGIPLWLRDGVGSKVVWAYNWRHLEDLEFFLLGNWRMHRHIGCATRSGGPYSYRTRLPQWMHLQSNRVHILRALKRIKAKRL